MPLRQREQSVCDKPSQDLVKANSIIRFFLKSDNAIFHGKNGGRLMEPRLTFQAK